MIGCYYVSVGAAAFGWTQMVPSIITLCLALLTAATNESIYFLFGLYLYIPQYMVWCLQYYFQWVRPDPVCQAYHTWAFPSLESMYIGAIVGFFVIYTIAWNVNQSWMTWLVIYLIGIIPPVILVFTQYNRWWEVLISMLFGVLASVFFGTVLHLFIRPRMAYLRNFFPLYTLGYTDTMIYKDEKEIEDIRESLLKLHDSQYL